MDRTNTDSAVVKFDGCKCSKKVFERGLNFPRGYGCTRKVTVSVDGKFYCTIHDPARVAKKRAERDQKYFAQSAESEKRFRLNVAAPELLAVLIELRDDISKLQWGQPYPGRNHALMDRVDAAIAKAAP